MRSTLTDSPAASFTTLLLKATQHATGLVVKVAHSSPTGRPTPITLTASLDTHTGFAKMGADELCSSAFAFQFGFKSSLTLLILAMCKSSTFIYKFSFS